MANFDDRQQNEILGIYTTRALADQKQLAASTTDEDTIVRQFILKSKHKFKAGDTCYALRVTTFRMPEIACEQIVALSNNLDELETIRALLASQTNKFKDTYQVLQFELDKC